jgi:hypothetical protein
LSARADGELIMRALLASSLAVLGLSCSSAPASPSSTTLSFTPDAPLGQEAYVCFAFDATTFVGHTIRAIRWQPPQGGVSLHHATLYAFAGSTPDSPWPCDEMPNAVGLHIWGRGGADLDLSDDVGVQIPADTQRFVVQAHVLRTVAGAAGTATVTLEPSPSPPAHVAAWLSSGAPVPAIRPHTVEQSTSSCTLAADVHIVQAWPHMHQIGSEIVAAVFAAGGAVRDIVDVTPWSFAAQRTYAVSMDVSAGDSIAVTCQWENATDAYVLPGLKSTDEMCTFSMLVWPAESARWTSACP